MEQLFILNLTRDTFFRYNKVSPEDDGHNKILQELLTPPTPKEKISHWARTDRVIMVPKHLHDHVNKYYRELYF
jgi:hypothetical protein